jgi:hypothetical protein
MAWRPFSLGERGTLEMKLQNPGGSCSVLKIVVQTIIYQMHPGTPLST